MYSLEMIGIFTCLALLTSSDEHEASAMIISTSLPEKLHNLYESFNSCVAYGNE